MRNTFPKPQVVLCWTRLLLKATVSSPASMIHSISRRNQERERESPDFIIPVVFCNNGSFAVSL